MKNDTWNISHRFHRMGVERQFQNNRQRFEAALRSELSQRNIPEDALCFQRWPSEVVQAIQATFRRSPVLFTTEMLSQSIGQPVKTIESKIRRSK